MTRSYDASRAEVIHLTPKQANIYGWGWQAEARFRVAVCGRRFGKTFLAAKEIRRACRLAAQWQISPDNEIWYGAPTFRQAKRVFWQKLKRAIPASWRAGRLNESECSITLTSGHVIRIVGLDNYDALRGSGLWFFLGDEWADAQPECWSEVVRPMLSTSGGHALFIGTPKGFNHFHDLYAKGLPNGERDWRSWRYGTLEGGHVPAEEIAAARRELDQRAFRQEYEAAFEDFAGRVYCGFSRIESVRPCPLNPALPLHIGMDFNINPMSATVWQEQPDGTIWQVDEILIPTSSTHEMAGEIRNRYGRISHDPDRPELGHITIYPDPAGAQRRTSAGGQTDIGILRAAGLMVQALESHPAVRDRINLVNSRFQAADGTRRALVDPRCHESIKAYEGLTYRAGTSQPDKASGLDHLPDATGYYFCTRFAARALRGAHLSLLGR